MPQRGHRRGMGGSVTNNQVAQDNDGENFVNDMIGNFDDADEIRRGRVQNELEEYNRQKEAAPQQTRLVGFDTPS
jgi:hypothetical protein